MRAAEDVDHDPDDRRQFRDPQHEREPGVDEAEDDADDGHLDDEHEPARARAPSAPCEHAQRASRDRRRRRRSPTTDSTADPTETAELEVRAAGGSRIDEQDERLDPGRDRDRERDARQPERTDEDDRQRAVDRRPRATAAMTGVTVSWRA